jgi:hypothetical protein
MFEKEEDPLDLHRYHPGGFSYRRQPLDILRSFLLYYLHPDYIQMALFPGTPKLESRNCPEIVPGGVPTLGAHNSRLLGLIATRSQPNL